MCNKSGKKISFGHKLAKNDIESHRRAGQDVAPKMHLYLGGS